MSLEHWLAFTAATAILLIIPIRRPAVQRAVNRVGGTLLIGAGVAAAAFKRAA